MVIFKSFLLFVIFIATGSAGGSDLSTSSWYAGSQKGWLWYKQTLPPMIKKPQEQTLTKGHIYTQRLELFRKNFDEILAKAVLEPTLDNVQMMQQAQNAIMDRASIFEKMWMLSSIFSSQTFRASGQSNPQHRKVFQEQSDRQLTLNIKRLAKSYGLFFLFKEDCPYCLEFAPIVKELTSLYGFMSKAISPHGKSNSLFPEAELDNGTISVINPDGIFPSLFLVNPQSRKVIPLARGLVNLSQLRENFKVIIQFLEEAPHGK
jgi:conjugal transfer pilus assembly protein TraF